MSFGKSANDFLLAREGRQAILSEVLRPGEWGKQRATVFLSLKNPGPDKSLPGSDVLFKWMLGELFVVFPELTPVVEVRDALGPDALASLDMDPVELKKRCIELETSCAAGRLIDLDVYSARGIQIDRQHLSLPGRVCLVCDQAAVECIRNKRHSFDEVIGKVNELL